VAFLEQYRGNSKLQQDEPSVYQPSSNHVPSPATSVLLWQPQTLCGQQARSLACGKSHLGSTVYNGLPLDRRDIVSNLGSVLPASNATGIEAAPLNRKRFRLLRFNSQKYVLAPSQPKHIRPTACSPFVDINTK